MFWSTRVLLSSPGYILVTKVLLGSRGVVGSRPSRQVDQGLPGQLFCSPSSDVVDEQHHHQLKRKWLRMHLTSTTAFLHGRYAESGCQSSKSQVPSCSSQSIFGNVQKQNSRLLRKKNQVIRRIAIGQFRDLPSFSFFSVLFQIIEDRNVNTSFWICPVASPGKHSPERKDPKKDSKRKRFQLRKEKRKRNLPFLGKALGAAVMQ